MSRTPTKASARRPRAAAPTASLDVVVAHSAPAAVRARRGDDVAMARLAVSTAVTIRHVAPSGFRTLRISKAVDDVRDALVFEGRVWRHACPDRTLPEILAALADPDPRNPVRLDLDDLGLDPFSVDPSTGTVLAPYPVVADAERERVVLDTTARATSGMAARFARSVAHDGSRLLVAEPLPLLGGGLHEREAFVKRREENSDYHRRNGGLAPPRYALPRAHPSAAEGYARFVARQRRYTVDAAEMRASASRLSASIATLEDEPMADLARFVRLQSVQLMDVSGTVRRYATRERPKLAGEGLDRLKAHLDRLRPIAALAACDLVEERDVPAAIDVIYSAAAFMREHAPHTGSYAIGALDAALAYVENVARPRLAAAPIHEADAESLSGLNP